MSCLIDNSASQVESKAVVALKVDADGKVRHDALLHQGKNKDKVHTSLRPLFI